MKTFIVTFIIVTLISFAVTAIGGWYGLAALLTGICVRYVCIALLKRTKPSTSLMIRNGSDRFKRM